MNRRKAIFAVLAGLAGRITVNAQEPAPKDSSTVFSGPSLQLQPHTTSVLLDLGYVTKFTFLYRGEEINLTGDEIWLELHKS